MEDERGERALEHRRAVRRATISAAVAGILWLIWYVSFPINGSYFYGYIFHLVLIAAFWVAVVVGGLAAREASRLRRAVLADVKEP